MNKVLSPLSPEQPFTPIPWEVQVRNLYRNARAHETRRHALCKEYVSCCICGVGTRNVEPHAWVDGVMIYCCSSCKEASS